MFMLNVQLRSTEDEYSGTGQMEASTKHDEGEQRVPDDPGRRGAVAIILRGQTMLVVRRSRTVVAPLCYCFPGGGIEPGESEEAALVRRNSGGTRRCGPACAAALAVRHRLEGRVAWWLAALDSDAVPVANPAEVESVHWHTPAEMTRLPGLLQSNRLFLELIERGEIRLEDNSPMLNVQCSIKFEH